MKRERVVLLTIVGLMIATISISMGAGGGAALGQSPQGTPGPPIDGSPEGIGVAAFSFTAGNAGQQFPIYHFKLSASGTANGGDLDTVTLVRDINARSMPFMHQMLRAPNQREIHNILISLEDLDTEDPNDVTAFYYLKKALIKKMTHTATDEPARETMVVEFKELDFRGRTTGVDNTRLCFPFEGEQRSKWPCPPG